MNKLFKSRMHITKVFHYKITMKSSEFCRNLPKKIIIKGAGRPFFLILVFFCNFVFPFDLAYYQATKLNVREIF